MRIDNPLGQPIGALMRETAVLRPEDSLVRAADLLRASSSSAVPVVDGTVLLGVVDEQGILAAHAAGRPGTDPAISVLRTGVPILAAHAAGAEALRLFDDLGVHDVVVVDRNGIPIGLISPSDLFPKPFAEPRPPLVGGMATPFGVYLTNGNLRAGAGDLALLATGALLFATFVLGELASRAFTGWAAEAFRMPLALQDVLLHGLPVLLFLVGIRSLPLAGIHAAEHKVVHALERGEPLIPEVVARMPRVHPRCGTNIAAAAGLFTGTFSLPLFAQPGWEDVRLLAAILVTVSFWRPFGSFLQWAVTTKPPTAKQIDMGIRAARELLEKYRYDRHPPTSVPRRIWASGMLHVIGGSMLALGVLELAAWAMGWTIPM